MTDQRPSRATAPGEGLTVEDIQGTPVEEQPETVPPTLGRLARAIADASPPGAIDSATVDAIRDRATAGLGQQAAKIAESIKVGQGIAMGKPYQDLVSRLMVDRDRAREALARPAINARSAIPPIRNYELEALYDVAEGVDQVAEAQRSAADAQKLAADQLLHVGELLEALHETIRTGDRSNGRLAKVAIVIAVVSLLVAVAFGVIPLVRG